MFKLTLAVGDSGKLLHFISKKRMGKPELSPEPGTQAAHAPARNKRLLRQSKKTWKSFILEHRHSKS